MEKITYKKYYSNERDEVRSITFKRDGNKKLEIYFGGNLDLYFALRNFETDSTFLIGQDNYKIWLAFDRLYNEIVNAKVYEYDDTVKKYDNIMVDLGLEDESFLIKKEQEHEALNSNLKNSYEYKKLVQDNKIIWQSDDFPLDVAPYFQIEKIGLSYIISFHIPSITRKLNLEEKHMINDYRYANTISVRISNSGSSYHPFNIPFMKAFNFLMEELKEEYEQIHIEEYLIDKRLEQGESLEKILTKKIKK